MTPARWRKSAIALAIVTAAFTAAWLAWAMHPWSASPLVPGGYPVRLEISAPEHPRTPALVPAPSIDVPGADETVAEVPTEAGSAPAVRPRVAVNKPDILPGLIPLNFRLDGPGRSSESAGRDAIAVDMPLVFNDASMGSVPIWVDPAGAITIDSAKLSGAISSSNSSLAEAISQSGQERTSFSSLRARGLSINYDPIANRIVMKSRP